MPTGISSNIITLISDLLIIKHAAEMSCYTHAGSPQFYQPQSEGNVYELWRAEHLIEDFLYFCS